MMMWSRWITVAAALAGCLAVAAPARATDHFLTIGGGYSPSGNQVSLEKNVQYFQRMLGDMGLGAAPQHVLFADGAEPGRDLQVADHRRAVPKVNQYLSAILGSTKGMRYRYRSHELKTDGPSARNTIDQWFDDEGQKLDRDDRLVLYFTGHGGKGEKDNAENTTIMLWNRASFRMKEFVERLDKVEQDTPVVLVMVQCYSGGFANVIFNEGDPKKGLTDHDRAGFFATVHSRPAAGCTPDIREENYQEYSTYFWAALYGETRLGEKVDTPDFNDDGKVSFDEAHAYALIASDSIDISIKTSDALLRHFSRTKAENGESQDELLTADSDYAKLLEHADASSRAVLEALSAKLGLEGEQRAAQARKLEGEFQNKRNELNKEKGKLAGEARKLRSVIADAIKAQYPELDNPFHPLVTAMCSDEAAGRPLVELIESHPSFKRFMEISERVEKFDTEARDFERQWVKCKRFEYVAESVALAANLEKVAEEQVVARYRKLLEAERATLKRGPNTKFTAR